MPVRHLRISVTCAFLFAVLISTAVFGENTPSIPALSDAPVIREKDPEVLSSRVRDFLADRDGDTVKVWVFFTDKNVRTKAEFASKAASLSLSDKLSKRRAKMGLDKIVFADLPVVASYVEAVTSRGGKLRRVSRWLNAASYELPANALDAVAALPFVAAVEPIAGFKVDHPEVQDTRPPQVPEAQDAEALNYGPSLGQLNQVNVPAVHSQGYHGEGVTLAIFDTGFRKSHEAFAQHYADGRVQAEYDFVFNDSNTANEPADIPEQWNHGTYIWSVCGGLKDGKIYGPAYHANFLLAKTEDMRSETPVEEDNWIAALEWADSYGADVVTSSLAYADWYTYEDVDGLTAPITLAANTASGLGIVVCNAMGNEGPSPGTLHPPADAFDILACGAVTSHGYIAAFSSRGPTYDGRIKPEVCAQGVNTYAAYATSDVAYGTVNGTSLSTPIVAGAACLLIQARPEFTPHLIRQAIIESASNADSPDNNYGWGIVNLSEAFRWGANFSADTTVGDAPFSVQFSPLPTLPTSAYKWYFGDGDSSTAENPIHEYSASGVYSVSLTVETAYGSVTNMRNDFVIALGDTLAFGVDSAFGGQDLITHVFLTNSQPLSEIFIPFQAADSPLDLTIDSIRFGDRTSYFAQILYSEYDASNNLFALSLLAGSGAEPLEPGSGEVMRVYWSTDPWSVSGQENTIDTVATLPRKLVVYSPQMSYTPHVQPGELRTIDVDRGDLDYDHVRGLADITGLIDYVYLDGPPPVSLATGDINGDRSIDLGDITGLIGFVYLGGPAPVDP